MKMAVKNCFIRGSVVRYVQLPAEHVDTQLLEDATRRGALTSSRVCQSPDPRSNLQRLRPRSNDEARIIAHPHTSADAIATLTDGVALSSLCHLAVDRRPILVPVYVLYLCSPQQCNLSIDSRVRRVGKMKTPLGLRSKDSILRITHLAVQRSDAVKRLHGSMPRSSVYSCQENRENIVQHALSLRRGF